MPPEWAPHLACYLAWPHNRDTWPDKFDVIPPIYAEMVAKIARFEPVRLAVTDEKQIDEVRAMILDAARRTEKETPGPLLPIDIFHLPTNDAWVARPRPDLRQPARERREPPARIKSHSTGASTRGAKSTAPSISTTSSRKSSARATASK